jgi:Tol biopolymer transport system component
MMRWRGTVAVGWLLMLNLSTILLAFAFGRVLPASAEIAFQFGQGDSRSLYLLDIHYRIAVQLARGTDPFPNYSWSPDGKQLAYVSQVNDRADIFRLDVECPSLLMACGAPDNLTQQREADTEPAWSPDGTGIVFVTERNGAPEIYWMPADSGTAYNLTHDSATDSFPIWSPDGHYMAFYSDRSGFLEVYVMDMNCLRDITSCPTAVHHLGGGFNSLPAWSPDSQQLAYFANGDLFIVQTKCLAQSDTCASQAYNLTRSPFTDWYPVWSPDSQHLLFQSNRSREPQIYTAAVNCDSNAGDCATPLKSELSYSLYPSFSPDGRWIMLLASQGHSQERYRLAVNSSTVQQLTNMGGQISSARWRPIAP